MSAAASPSGDDSVSALIWPVIGAWVAGALALLSSYARNWLLSGSGLETLLLLSGPSLQSDVPSGVLVLVLNIVYAVASTSWLLHIVFASFCWPLVLATSITQYVLISRFMRGRLRWLLKEMHFHRDKVAFFSFPVLIIDTGISGFVAVQGVTVSMLTLTVEVHSIDLALNIGQGHEVHVHTNSLEIKLFRRIVIGEIFAAHKCLEDERESAFEVDDPLDEDANAHNKFHEPSADKIAKDNIDHETSIKHRNQAPDSNEVVAGETENNHSTALDDEDAELRYTQLLNDIHTGGRLYQMRERLKAAYPDRKHTDPESIELRAILSTELRRTGLSPPAKCDRVTTSKLATLFPEPDIFQYVPSALRALLWLASHTHPIECPSISVAGSGHWLNDLLAQLVFRRHSTDDERIVELEREISEWLSVGEYCVDLRNITALGQVPLRSAYNIKSEIRSTGIAISRVDVESESSAQMASLAGVDGSFVIPTCLLPHHTHLIPPEPSPVEVKAVQEKKREKAADAEEARVEEETAGTTKADVKIVEPQPSKGQLEDESEEEPEDLDALGVLMSIRATLPAHFDESCLSFAATLSKAAQMLEIEESIVDPPTPMPYDENLDPTDSFREKFSRRSKQLGSVMKHPLQTAQGAFQREIRKGTVMRVNGAWFAKWTNKILEQLAWLNGDVGYTFEIPVSLKPYR